jgi:hypothetical protein
MGKPEFFSYLTWTDAGKEGTANVKNIVCIENGLISLFPINI